MKESVVDIHDLQEAAPFFKSRFGSFLGKVLIKWLSIDKVNKAHAHNCHLRGAEFTTALLNDPLIDIKYDLHNAEVLDHLPEGAALRISAFLVMRAPTRIPLSLLFRTILSDR